MTNRTRRSPDRARVGANGKSDNKSGRPYSSSPSHPATGLQALAQDAAGALRVEIVDMLDLIERGDARVSSVLKWITLISRRPAQVPLLHPSMGWRGRQPAAGLLRAADAGPR